jgi:outer membrane protein OmpA-like peptidoglycan-associated protein
MKKITFIILLFCAPFIYAQEGLYHIENISFNTKYNDFGVSYFGPYRALFVSSRKNTLLDLYIGDIEENGNIINVVNFSKNLNTKLHEGRAVFTKNLKTVYFTGSDQLNNKAKKSRSGAVLNKIYRAEVGENGKWLNVQPMPFNRVNYQTGHPVLNDAEDKMYFISDMPGTRGLTDIFVVDISEDGYVGRPRNLGDIVNTNKREMYPYIDENDILFFSSEGFDDTKGMLDVYTTKLKADGTYYKPINLGATINSNKDDFSFTKHKGMNTGHFSSNRSGGKGGDDIYAFIQNSPEDFESDRLVTGQITDKNSGEILPGAIAILFDENGLELNRQTVGSDAIYNFEVKKNKTYKIKGNIEVYSKQIEEFTAKGNNCIIKIETIYFDLNSSILRSEAILELDKVVQIMRKYPAIIIESSSHTDSRESDQYNNWISEKRAKRSMDYIVSKGIHPNRISAKGYGETQLINSCSNGTYCSEESHQLNRRTEFRIVNLNEIKNRYPDICLPK